jgi:hypothetical protein
VESGSGRTVFCVSIPEPEHEQRNGHVEPGRNSHSA